MWLLILLILSAMIPILGIFTAFAVFMWIVMDWDIKFFCPQYKIFKFLGKPIK